MEHARPANSSPKPSTNRLPELDLLRFVAASVVVFYHYCYNPVMAARMNSPLFTALNGVARYGYLGVDLFFVISGFVILMTAQRRSPRGFLIHRGLRLYPSFWVAVALTTTVQHFLGDPSKAIGLRDAVLNLTMVPSYVGAQYVDAVYWTLAVELKFYVIVFVLMLAGQVKYGEWWAYAWLVGSSIEALGYGGRLLASVTLAPYGAFFAAGTLLFVVYSKGWNVWRIAGIVLAAFLAQMSAVQGIPNFMHDQVPGDALVVRVIIVVSFAAIAAAATWPGTLRKPAAWAALGALTYPLYLIHARIGYILSRTLSNFISPGIAMIVVALVIYGAAWALSVLIERRLVPWLSHRPVVVALEQPRRELVTQ